MKKWSWLVAPAIVIALAAMPAHAAKGGGGKLSSSAVGSTIAFEPYSVFQLGGTVGFDTNAVGLAGWEYPMVAVSCYQDVNDDGTIDTDLLGPDVVYTWLDHPNAEFVLGAYSSIWTLRGGGAAKCRGDLDAYGWKSGQESIRVLKSITFDAADKS